MKNTTKMETMFNQELNTPQTIKTNFRCSISQYAKLLLVSFILIFFASCDRNIANGCGTWPTAHSNHYKSGKHDAVKKNNMHNNNRQYAYYK